MTDRSYREESLEPSVDLVALVRARMLRWLGHVLRAEESYLLKKVVVGYVKDKVEGSPLRRQWARGVAPPAHRAGAPGATCCAPGATCQNAKMV